MVTVISKTLADQQRLSRHEPRARDPILEAALGVQRRPERATEEDHTERGDRQERDRVSLPTI